MSEICTMITANREVIFSGNYLFLHQVVRGSATVKGARGRHVLVEDGFLLQNVGSKHTVIAGSCPIVTIGIHSSLLPNERFEECLTPRDFLVDRATSNLMHWGRRADAPNLSFLARDLTQSLLIARDKSTQRYFLAERTEENENLADTMRQAREFILARLAGPLSVSDVADGVALSPFHFHRVFTRWHGITPGKYIVVERVRRACRRLVLNQDSVATVASDCGFLSSTSFTRAFKIITGTTPVAFKRLHQKRRAEMSFYLNALKSCSN